MPNPLDLDSSTFRYTLSKSESNRFVEHYYIWRSIEMDADYFTMFSLGDIVTAVLRSYPNGEELFKKIQSEGLSKSVYERELMGLLIYYTKFRDKISEGEFCDRYGITQAQYNNLYYMVTRKVDEDHLDYSYAYREAMDNVGYKLQDMGARYLRKEFKKRKNEIRKGKN